MRVLISGAGIAGPALARCLARSGACITILEKSQSLLAQGQNIDIEGTARKVVEKMGLTEKILQCNTTEKGTQFIDSKGKPFGLMPVKHGNLSFTSPFEILRGDLASILYDATKDYSNVQYLFGTTITKVLSNNDDGVTVELSNGTVQEFDLLVAADGQWSKVRAQCFAPEEFKVVDLGMYVVYYTIPRLPCDNDFWNIYVASKSRVITLRPDPHGTIRAMFTRMPRNSAQTAEWQKASRSDRKTQKELLVREYSDAGWQAQRLLDAVDDAPDFYFQAVQQIKMAKWSKSRVVCLGDAAYAPTPLTGMGTSLAILGAYVLGGELSELAKGEHPAKALEAYESKLRPFVEGIQNIPFFVPGIAHPTSAWSRWLLQGFLSAVAKVATSSWMTKKIDHGDREDFPMPQYTCLDEPDLKGPLRMPTRPS